MIITYFDGKFYCDAAPTAGVMKNHKWKWDGEVEQWSTSMCEKVEPLYTFCSKAAKLKLDKWKDAFLDEIKDSFALDSSIQIPAPEGLSYLGYQKAGVDYSLKHDNHILIGDLPGLGKAAPLDSKLLTPDGWVRMGNAYVGMPIIGQDGKEHTVTGVFPQGIRKIFRVHFRDGTSTECCDEHLWTYMTPNHVKRKQGWQIAPLAKLMDMGFKNSFGKNKFQIPLMSPAHHSSKDLLIHPYIIGVLLGNGCLNQKTSLQLTTHVDDYATVKKVEELLFDGLSLTNRVNGNTRQTYIVDIGTFGNRFMDEIKRLNLNVLSGFKFIPNEYMFASIEQRTELLRGLMDADGSAQNNRIVYHSCNEKLANDVASLVRSLGGVAIVRKYIRSDGKTDECQVNVKLNFCPFYLSRKAAEWWPACHNNRPVKYMESAEYVGMREAQCISVSAPDKLYVTDDYIVTHNTIEAIGYHNITYGKAQPLDAKVLSPQGWRTMGSLKVGSCISNPAGGVQWVTAIYDQGDLPSYRVTFHDGTSAECCDEHLWRVEVDGDMLDLELKNIFDGMKCGKSYYIQTVVSPVYDREVHMLVDPYLVGAVYSGKAFIDHTNDVAFIACETGDQIDSLIGAMEIRIPSLGNYQECHDGLVINKTIRTTDIYTMINQWNHYVESNDDILLYADHIELISTKERLLILQGYLDASGEPKSGYSAEVPFISAQANEVIKRIVNSIGGVCIENEENLLLTFPWDIDPFLIPSKAITYNNKNDTSYHFYPRKKIVNVVPVRTCPMRCIRVSSPERLYVTNDYIVTHNTSSNTDAHGVLLIVPATLKANWRREWEKWDVHGLSVGLCESKLKTKTVTDDDGEKTIKRWTESIFPDTDVVICNYEQMEKYDVRLKARRWRLVIVDEADRLRNMKSKQNKVFFGGTHSKKDKESGKTTKKKFDGVEALKILFLTGTPIPKSPINMWPIIEACDPRGLGASWKKFVYRYCDAKNGGFGLDTTGASNLEELQFRMRQRFLVRRDKKLALPDLPESRRQIVFLPSDGLNRQIQHEFNVARKGIYEYEKMMGLRPKEDPTVIEQDQLMEFMRAYGERMGNLSYADSVARADNTVLDFAFEEFAEARQQLSIAKVPMMVERIKAALEDEDSIVFFGVHHEFISAIASNFDNYAMITGRVPVKKRQGEVDRFMNDQDCRIFFGNIHAAGVGITLTRAWWTMFGELAWNETEVSQAEQRTWRIGQKNNCLSQHMIVEDSLDARFVPILYEKKDIGERALDIDRLTHSAVYGQRAFG